MTKPRLILPGHMERKQRLDIMKAKIFVKHLVQDKDVPHVEAIRFTSKEMGVPVELLLPEDMTMKQYREELDMMGTPE